MGKQRGRSNQQGKGRKRDRKDGTNRQKRWFKECAKRGIKLQKMKNLPPPPPQYYTERQFSTELEEVHNGFRKTRSQPSIFYKPVVQEEEIEGQAGTDFNTIWREQFVAACLAARSGRQPVVARFIAIPEYEKAAKNKTRGVRVEPTAMANGYQVYKRNNLGDRYVPDRPLIHVKFYFYEKLARETKKKDAFMEPRADWRTCERVQFNPGKCTLLDTRFRTPGADKDLRSGYARDFPDGLELAVDMGSEECTSIPLTRFRPTEELKEKKGSTEVTVQCRDIRLIEVANRETDYRTTVREQ